jgi:hypothetical protein
MGQMSSLTIRPFLPDDPLGLTVMTSGMAHISK